MPRRPAIFTRTDLARAIREAKREGASGVEFRPDGTIFVQISPKMAADPVDDAEIALAPGREIDL